MCSQDEWKSAGASGEKARILQILTDRYNDLKSCSKDDSCGQYAYGVWLAIDDIDSRYAESLREDPLRQMMQEANQAGLYDYDIPLKDYVMALRKARQNE